MPLVGPLSSMIGPTIAGLSRDAQNAICLPFMWPQVIFWPYILNMLWWECRDGMTTQVKLVFSVCDDLLTQTLCYSHSCSTWKFVEVCLPGSRCSATNRTFSASVSGLNVAKDGGICHMNVKNLRIGGSGPSWLYKQNLIIKGSSPSSWLKSRVQVPLVQSNQGFESHKSIQAKGSSPSSPI